MCLDPEITLCMHDLCRFFCDFKALIHQLRYGGHHEFWQIPPWDSWGLFCVISTRCLESIYKNSALTPKFLPQILKPAG